MDSADHRSHELKREMEELLGALAVARRETIGHRECEVAVVAALEKLRMEVDQDGSRVAQAAGALATEGAATVKLKSALEAEQSQRDKAEAVARTSSEAAVAHLNQLQLLHEEKDGTVLPSCSVFIFLLVSVSLTSGLCLCSAALAGHLSETEAALQRATEERQALGAVAGAAAQRLQAPLQPGSSLTEQFDAVLMSWCEWTRRAVRFGVRTSISVLATHYGDLDFPLVSTGHIPGYTAEELAEIRVVIDPSTDALAAQYKEEALPGEGEN